MRDKHVWTVGRWRIAFRFGRYQTGWKYGPYGKLTFALPFLWVTMIRRTKAAL